LNKGELARRVAEKVRFKKRKKERQQHLFPEFDYQLMTQKRARQIVNTLFHIIARTLERGEQVRISGFGKFQVKFKWARKGRHPRTGEPIILKSRRIVTFRSFSRLREKVNRPPE